MRAFEFRFYDPISYIFIYSDWYEKMSEFFEAYEKTDWGRNERLPLQQYTGLQDAKGNKIFEGDILKSHMGDLVVMFTNGKFIAEIKDKQPGKWDYRIEARLFYQVPIIGNIYENGELLNEQK